MLYKYVFLLGRPGCGKSALYRELEKRIRESGQAQTFERVDDFPKVWAKLQADDALERAGKTRLYSQRTADGGYLTNKGVLNGILKEVNSDVLKIDKPDHVVFIEFSRSSYIRAFQSFDTSILEHCIAIYIQVSFDICWARNVARHGAASAKGGDDHLLGRETMEKIFLYDDQDAFVQHMQEQDIPILVVNNEAQGKEHLRKQVQELLKTLFQADPSHP